jgi:Malectin domain
LADVYFDAQSDVYNTSSAIANTTEDTLYQTERTGLTVGYNIPRPPGTYVVTLHFAEI